LATCNEISTEETFTGEKQRLIQPIQIQVRDGKFEIMGMGAWHSYWRDPYHLLLTIPWTGFLILICTFYITINALFAVAYLIGGDCIANARPGSFLDVFFFSVQTLASIGYGAMYRDIPTLMQAYSVGFSVTLL